MSFDDFFMDTAEVVKEVPTFLGNSSGIYDIIEELREDNGGNYKLSVLRSHKDNELFKKVLDYTYSPFKQYYIKQIPERGDLCEDSYIELDTALNFLDKLSHREVTGSSAREQLSYILDQLHPDDAKVLTLIMGRGLDCGINAKSINKAIDGLISEIPYMRCEKLNDKTKKNISYPAIVQLKADGTFLNVIKHKKNVYCMTRNGSKFHINKVNEYLERVLTDVDDFVITGEVVLYKDGKVLERKEGNGRINSYIKREDTRQSILDKQKSLAHAGKMNTSAFTKLVEDITQRELEWAETESMMVVEGWDMIPYNDWVAGQSNDKYMVRFDKFKKVMKECNFIESIPTKEVNSFEEAMDFANEMMSQGLEGGVLKNLDGIWENKTSKNQIKLKAELDADLLVVGYIPGTGEFEGGIGALICETSDGILNVSLGTGFKREDRGLQRVDENDMTKGLMLLEGYDTIDAFYNETYKNKIVEAKYNEVIKSRDKDTFSLFLPVFQSVRFDKTVADDIRRLLK